MLCDQRGGFLGPGASGFFSGLTFKKRDPENELMLLEFEDFEK